MTKSTVSACLKRLSIGAAMIAAMCLGLIASTPAIAADGADSAKPPFTLTDFNPPFTFSYQSWQDKVQVADGHAVLKGLPCNGGAGVNGKMDLSPYANCIPVIRVKTTAANTAKMIQLQLVDADQTCGNWQFTLPAPSDDFVTVTPTGRAPLSKPNLLMRKEEPVTGKMDLAHIVQFQVQGDWQEGVVDVQIDAIVLVQPDAKGASTQP